MGLEELTEAIENKEKELRKKREEKIRKERKWEKEEKTFWKKEQKYMPKKQKLTNEIFVWIEKFKKTKEYKKLEKLTRHGVELPSLRWGTKFRDDYYGCWSRLYIQNNEIYYEEGFKGWCKNKKLPIDSTEKIAKKFKYSWIKNLYDLIKSGEIYDQIAEKNLKYVL